MPYKCVFFDLDHTLWDYETNSKETLEELYGQYHLFEKGVWSFDDFYLRFREVNFRLWDLFDRGIITSAILRKERFKQVLEFFHAYEERLSDNLANDYLEICPTKNNLMPNAIETLQYLSGKYSMTVITNGFEETQHIKLTAGNLHSYFGHVITSQRAGHRKPAREIFEMAMKCNGVTCREAIMIGDNLLCDVGGARNASIDAVFFNPDRLKHSEEVVYEISNLKELSSIL